MVGLKSHKDSAKVLEARNIRCRSFRCYLCQKKFNTTRKLNIHFKETHEGLDCEECGKGFNSPLSLKKHSYMHSACKYPCNVCGKKFPFPSQRTLHMNSHSDIRHSCTKPGCDSLFTRESDLRLHLELHDKEPIKCNTCGYSNPDIRNVRQHERTHTDEEPYQCRKCPKTYKFAMQCKRHEQKCDG